MEKLQIPKFSVSDFVAIVNQTLDFAYPTIEVEGEVNEFKLNQGKFIFFNIKDDDSSVGCFMMAFSLRTPIQDGMKVVITATPKITKWGKFSLTVKSIRPSGEGSIKKSFEILKSKLDGEGLFSFDRKRKLPLTPSHIAVISSVQAAGYADFTKILNDRWGGIKIDVAQTLVQGASAPDQIIRAINYFNQQEVLPEVLVIIRGGGSADDLSAFNDELLARAIAGSRIPTLVGVGHEVDESLADLVADVRASTPSNAAQILTPDRNELIRSTKGQISYLLPKILQIIDNQKQALNDLMISAIEEIERALNDQTKNIMSIKNLLSQLNPKNILARGYALLRGKIEIGSIIEVETSKIIMKAEVKNVSKK
jgi:exodeoxyribonuclease VII large subunit